MKCICYYIVYILIIKGIDRLPQKKILFTLEKNILNKRYVDL